jgi:hypothetical protein
LQYATSKKKPIFNLPLENTAIVWFGFVVIESVVLFCFIYLFIYLFVCLFVCLLVSLFCCFVLVVCLFLIVNWFHLFACLVWLGLV